MAEKTLFLLDGYALIYRAYFAFINNPRINSSGLNTSAMFGFTNLLLDVIKKHKPSHIAVVFDPQEEASSRNGYFEAYKANRQEMPEDLRKSIPYVAQIIDAFRIPLIVEEGYEADDVIGTLAKQAEKRGFTTYMMTSDKDYGQLVTAHTFWYKPGRMGSPDEVLGVNEVCKKFEVAHPEQVIDLLGLMGDSSDNIPGIPGVGPKTAVKLLKEFKTVENLIENADKLEGKIAEKVKTNTKLALVSKQLATIITDVPVTLDEEALILEEPNYEKLNSLFTELEFKSLMSRIPALSQTAQNNGSQSNVQMVLFGDNEDASPSGLNNIQTIRHQYFFVNDVNWRKDLCELLLKQTDVCIDIETTSLDPMNTEIVGLSFSFKPYQAFYIPLPNQFEEAASILQSFASVFTHSAMTKIGQNIKYDMAVLMRYGINLEGPLFDTMLAHYIIQPDMRHNLDTLAETYLRYTPITFESLVGPKGKNQLTVRDIPQEKVAEYCNEDADVTLQLKTQLKPLLIESKTLDVFEKIEMPLVSVLCRMEYEGVSVDSHFLTMYGQELEKDALALEKQIHKLAGEPFNIASPKQLGEILFDKLKIDPKAKKTKTGQYATGEDILSKLSEHEIVQDILEYREIAKLKSTYIDALPLLVNPTTGRIHTSFMQAVTVTGRLSSQNPNLQNIPIRTERGRKIRQAFVPRSKDFKLLSADYSQIELRLMAEMSEDAFMIDAFKQNKDIHTATAAKVYNIPENEVTKEMRGKAKSVNFGIIYGQSAFGLAENLGISRTEAKTIIDQYFQKFPGVRDFMDRQIAFAKNHGYVETLMGRKRKLNDIHSANFTVRGFAERNAINMPLQGSAADMIKLAMIRIDEQFQKQRLKSAMILQVHDELIFDVYQPEMEKVKEIVRTFMQNALPMKHVPIIVEIGVGDNWLEAH
ncbi:MAG: DNA polymerase I [Flavobacteriales bacterium]|nr:DNA polymerase I [Flavobacteriales bacterium]